MGRRGVAADAAPAYRRYRASVQRSRIATACRAGLAPVNALFVVGFAFTTMILLHFSTVISRLSRENRELAQRDALLVYRLQHDGAIVDAEETKRAAVGEPRAMADHIAGDG